MLHAFDASLTATGGQEKWAIIPSAVLPNLYKLADNDYGPNHQFFVDGSPVVGDVYGGGAWRTILVGGLNNGGKGYYAVDVTDPTAMPPRVLWEFKQQCPAVGTSDCDLGLSYGKPVITKLNVGGSPKWVVMVTSGYNNLNGNGTDGGGYLYVLDALNGTLIYKIGTEVGGLNVGSAAAPSGLAQINNYVDNALIDNTTLRAYGGDLLGNVWRFDFPPSVAVASATLIGTAKDAANNPQPITTRPELAEIGDKPFVMVGTGELLGVTDLASTRQQSVYGFRDTLAAGPGPIYADPLRGSLRHLDISQAGVGAGATRTVTACNLNCAATAGWVLDLAESGERVNVEMKVVLGSLVFASNVPESQGLTPEEVACGIGGHSWFNQIDFRDGTVVPGASFSQYLSSQINVGFNVLQLPLVPGRNAPSYVGPGRQADATNVNGGVLPPTPPASGRRISWREVAN
jgi:type IV pilus assembly protein PilY1